jgi:hypothetical protein
MGQVGEGRVLSKIILFGERSLRRALSEYVAHYHAEQNHQGKSNVLLFRRVTETRREEPVQCRERLWALALLPSRGCVSWRENLGRWL